MEHDACSDHTTHLAGKAFHDDISAVVAVKFSLPVLRAPSGYYSNRIAWIMCTLSERVRKSSVFQCIER